MHSFLEVGIEPQHLQKENGATAAVYVCDRERGELTCLSKATQAGWFPPTPLGNTLLFFLGDCPGSSFPPGTKKDM